MPPAAPQSNQQPFFGVKVSKPGVPVQKATPGQLVYSNTYNVTTFYDSNGQARVLLGQLSGSTYGLQVSIPGVDVTQATNGQYAFNSALPGLQSVWSTSGTQVVGTNVTIILGPFTTGTGVITLPLITCAQDNTNFNSFSGTATPAGLQTVVPSISFSAADRFLIQFPTDVSNTHTYVYTVNMMLLTNQVLT